MRTILLLALASLISLAPVSHAGDPPAKEQAFTRLFNGRDLGGWSTFLQKHGKNADPDHVITIDNGVIHLYRNAADGDTVVMGYIATEKEYGDYHLRVQYRWGTKKFQPALRPEARRGNLLPHPGTRRRLAAGASVPGGADQRRRPDRPARLPARLLGRPDRPEADDADVPGPRPGRRGPGVRRQERSPAEASRRRVRGRRLEHRRGHRHGAIRSRISSTVMW